LIKLDEDWISSLGDGPGLAGLTWGSFVVDNLVPVTIGNLLGGTLMVAAVYWLASLRPRRVAKDGHPALAQASLRDSRK
jgi:formate transporter